MSNERNPLGEDLRREKPAASELDPKRTQYKSRTN